MFSGEAVVTILHGAGGGKAWPTFPWVSATANVWRMPADTLDEFLSMPRVAKLHAAGALDIKVDEGIEEAFVKYDVDVPGMEPVPGESVPEELEPETMNMSQMLELASERGVSPREARSAVREGRVEGAEMVDGEWVIPCESFDKWYLERTLEEE